MNDIITKAQKGNKKAMETLYRSTCDELACYCIQLCGNEQDAQDLMQDTYLAAFEKLYQYRRDDNFKGWLHTIARNKLYNKIRDEKPQMLTELTEEVIDDEEEIYAPEGYAERKDVQRILDEIITGELSESQRITVTSYYYDEKNIHEISEELGCPEGTVKTRLYHSRRIIKTELIKRGFTVGGSVILVSAVFKAKAAVFTASAASTALAGEIVRQKATSAASQSVFAYAKGKLIAGAVAIAVAGGTAGVVYLSSYNKDQKTPVSDFPETVAAISTKTAVTKSIQTAVTIAQKTTKAVVTESVAEPPTGISEPGGDPVEYNFDSMRMTMMIPETYEVKEYFKSGTEENGYIFTEHTIMDRELENRTFIGGHVKEILVFRPDDFSGDEFILMRRLEEPENVDVGAGLADLYDNVELSESEDIVIHMDNTNSPDSPTERTGLRFSFKADDNDKIVKGTAIIFRGNMNKTHFLVFSDCSGIRGNEYKSIIESITLSFSDLSWKDNYRIPSRNE